MRKIITAGIGVFACLPMPYYAQAANMAAATASASASAGASDEVDEIVVSGARLRKESLQETPIATSVINAKQIEALHGADITSLTGKIPNVTISTLGTAPAIAVVSIRGFVTQAADISIEPGIPVYVDGIYQTNITGSMSDLFDVDRIEVLRGPQGTTLGKNASAGAVLVTRSRPTGEFGGRAGIEYGSHNLIQGQALVNFPIVEGKLAGKIFASGRHRDNWVKNLAVPGGDMGGESKGSVRAALLFTPNEKAEYYLTGDYVWDRSSQMGGRSAALPRDLICTVYGVGGCAPNTQYGTTYSGNTLKPKVDAVSVTGEGKFDFGGAKLTSLTGYRHFVEFNANDFDKTPFPALELFRADTREKQISEELRLTSKENAGLDFGGKLSWLLAAYYGHSDAFQNQGQNVFGGQRANSQKSIRDSYALFGHLDFKVTDKLTLSGGARHSWDKTKHLYSLTIVGPVANDPANEQRIMFQNTSYEAGMQYQLDASKMLYLRYAEGYRGGGFIGTPGSVATAYSYKPETSRSYEIGAKTEWLDKRVLINLTLFRTEFKDLQKQVARTGPTGNLVQVIDNAASARIEGIELESVLKPFDGFTMTIAGGYLHAKYKSYTSLDSSGHIIDLSGLPFQWAPKYTLSVAPEYTVNLKGKPLGFERARIGGRVNYSAAYEISSAVPPSPVGHQPAFTTADLTIGFDRGPINLEAYVTNLTDNHYLLYGNEPANLIAFQVDNIGRVFGVKAGYHF